MCSSKSQLSSAPPASHSHHTAKQMPPLPLIRCPPRSATQATWCGSSQERKKTQEGISTSAKSEKAREESTGKVGLKFWLEGGPITCIRQNLKKIIFHEFRGSANETAFLKFIAENARVLESMVIVVSDWLLSSGIDARDILRALASAKWASGACKFQVFKSVLREGERPFYGVRLASEVLPSDPFDKIYYHESLL